MKNDTMEIRTMRLIAWERAKGELNAVLQTYWVGSNGKFDDMREEVEKFIKAVEDNGYQD